LPPTVPPLLVLLAAMHAGLALGWWPVLALALPAAGLVVRVFALQHDCGHGSLFRSRRANEAVGRICSLFTLTPYGQWRRQHAGHHAVWNDLDHRDRGADIYSTCATVAEYRAMSRWHRLGYRAARHPLVAQLLVPPLIFLAFYRIPFDAPPAWRRERRGVHLTNLALAAFYGGQCALLGFGPVTSVLLAVMVPASVAGVWLFSVQHRFEGVRWSRHAEWDPVAASLEGSSFLQLPRILRWFTATSGSTTCTTSRHASRTTGWRTATTRTRLSLRRGSSPSATPWPRRATRYGTRPGRMVAFAEVAVAPRRDCAQAIARAFSAARC